MPDELLLRLFLFLVVGAALAFTTLALGFLVGAALAFAALAFTTLALGFLVGAALAFALGLLVGAAKWGQDGARIARLRAAADVAIYTPGSSAGLPVSVLKSFSGAAARDPGRQRTARRTHQRDRHGLADPARRRRPIR